MDELARPTDAPRSEPGASLDGDAGRRATIPLLAGYLAFGQYWGVWVIVVFDFQRFHDLSESRLGGLYTVLSTAAVAVMLLLAPRLQRMPLSATVPLSLLVLAAGSFVIAYQPTELLVLGFLLVGAANGLIDVYLNVAAQRVEVATHRPVLQWLHASYALGGVTGAARKLQADGAIEYRRGKITVNSRERLESYTCKCYEVVKTECERLIPGTVLDQAGGQPALPARAPRAAR